MSFRIDLFRCAMVVCATLPMCIVTGRAVSQVDVVRSVQPHLMERFILWLRLDEDQELLARTFCDNYRTVFEEEEGGLGDRVRAHNQLMPDVSQAHFEDAMRELGDTDRALRAEVDARTESLFENLQSILHDDQLPRMQRVRLGWERSRWSIRGGISLPEGNVDVIDLLDQLDLSPEEQRTVDAIIVEFEPKFVLALQAKGEAGRLEYSIWHKAQAILKNLDPSVLRDRQLSSRLEEEYWDLCRRAGRIRIGYNRHLVSLNRTALSDFLSVLSQGNATELSRLFLEKAYYAIYPDPATATTLYDRIGQMDDMTEDQLAAIDALRLDFERRHELLSQNMSKSTTDRRDASLRDTFDGRLTLIAEWRKLRKLGLEREELNAKQLNLLRPILTPGQVARLPEWDFKDNHRPRPWDQGNRTRIAEQREQRRQDEGEYDSDRRDDSR